MKNDDQAAKPLSAEVSLLALLFPELWQLIHPSLIVRETLPDETLIEPNEFVSSAHICTSGVLRAYAQSGSIGNSSNIDFEGKGEIIGLRQLLAGERFAFGVGIVRSGEIASFSLHALREFATRHPDLVVCLIRFNSSPAIRKLVRHLFAQDWSYVEIRRAINEANSNVNLKDGDDLSLKECGLLVVQKGVIESVLHGKFNSGEAIFVNGSDKQSDRIFVPKDKSAELVFIAREKLEQHGRLANLEKFPWQRNGDYRRVESDKHDLESLIYRPLPLEDLRAFSYNLPIQQLSWSRSLAEDEFHCAEHLIKLGQLQAKLSPVDFEISKQIRRHSLGRFAELFERTGLITRINYLRQGDLTSFPYPGLIILAEQVFVLVKADRDSLTLLHPRHKLIQIQLRDLRGWDGRVLKVEESEFEQALELARKKNFQNDRKLLAEFGLGGIFKKESSTFKNLIWLAIFGSLFEASLPLYVQTVIDRILVKKDFASEKTYIYGSILLLGFLALSKFLEKACRASQSQKIGLKVRRLFIRNMMQISSWHYGEAVSTDYFSRLTLIDKIVGIKSMLATTKITTYIEAAIYVAILGVLSPGIAVISLIGASLIVWVYRHSMEHISHEVHGMSDLKRQMRLRLGEQLFMASTIKSFGAEDSFVKRSEASYLDHQTSIRKMTTFERNSKFQGDLISCTVGALSLGILTYQAFHDAVTPGQFIAVMLLLQCFAKPALEIGNLAGEAKFLEIEEGAIAQYLIQGDYSYQTRLITEPKKLTGHIKFERVGFRYENNSGACLTDINFTVAPGEILAIVGRSGSGKTTVGRMIAGLIRPSFGNVYYDDIDSKSLSTFTLFDQIGYVSQKNTIFTGSILANIAFGDDNPDLARAQHAAELAGASEFINNLPAGWNQFLTTGGRELASGESIRICVARALYRLPKILVLDELGANLDPRTVQMIAENLTKTAIPMTLIVITQRLAAVKNVSKIIVMKNGWIVEEGRHGKLLKSQKEYSELFRSQVNSY